MVGSCRHSITRTIIRKSLGKLIIRQAKLPDKLPFILIVLYITAKAKVVLGAEGVELLVMQNVVGGIRKVTRNVQIPVRGAQANT